MNSAALPRPSNQSITQSPDTHASLPTACKKWSQLNTAVDRRLHVRAAPAVFLAALALNGCAAGDPPLAEPDIEMFGGPDRFSDTVEPPANAKELKRQSADSGSEDVDATARVAALRNDALRFGSQNGFRRRAWEIRRKLEIRSAELSLIYDFGRVARSAPKRTGFLLPPVIARSQHAFEADPDGETISAADEYFEILRSAAFSPTVPTWREPSPVLCR